MGLPLEGIRVADFSWIINGPQIAQWLATMGAEVIKIESQVYIDLGRTNPASMADGVIGINRAGYYHGLNYGKKAINLNLKHPKGARAGARNRAAQRFRTGMFPQSDGRENRPDVRRDEEDKVRHHHDFGLAAGQKRARTVDVGRLGSDGLLLRRDVRRAGLSGRSAAPDWRDLA